MNTTDLSKYDNSWYRPGSFFKRACWFVLNGLFIKASLIPIYSFKVFLLRSFGATMGIGIIIKPGVIIKYPWLLEIGDHCWIGEGVWIDNLAKVSLGKHVCLSQGAMILCGNHDFRKQHFDLSVAPVTLEDGVWIGAKAVVCPGITCYSHAVLAVGGVAVKNLEAYSIYQGNPCVRIRGRIID